MAENKRNTSKNKSVDALPQGRGARRTDGRDTSASRDRNSYDDRDDRPARDSGGDDRSGEKRTRAPRETIRNAVPEVPRSAKFVHQFIPYILFVAALFLAACFICVELFDASGSVGVVGHATSSFLCGIFGWPAFFMPLVLINLAVFWRRYVDMNLVPLKLVFSLLILLVLSALVHVVTIDSLGSEGFNVPALWFNGIDLRGGGVLGGLLGELCYLALGVVGSLIILIPGVGILLMFLFGTTPRAIMVYIKYRAKLARERREAEAPEREEAAEAKRQEKAKKRAEKKESKQREEEERKRRHEILEAASDEPVAAVFSDDNSTVVGNDTDKADEVATDETVTAKTTTAKTTTGGAIIATAPLNRKDGSTPEPEKQTSEPTGKDGHIELESVASCDSVYADNLEHDKSFVSIDKFISKGGAEGVPDENIPKEEPDGEASMASSQPEQKTAERASSSRVKEANITMGIDTEVVTDIESEDDEPVMPKREYVFPPIELLAQDSNQHKTDSSEALIENAKKLEATLRSFHISIDEINYSCGPTITRYELKPSAGVRVRSIANLVDDIALSLATPGVRIEAPIPGKSAVGVEVPNVNQATVYLRSLIDSTTFSSAQSSLAVCLGEDVGGKPIFFNIDKMPHLLIAGATGMGKSVCINCLIVSILYKATPEEVKLILIDPKKVEFSMYESLPHLYAPVVNDPKKAAGALAAAVAEMERRFCLIEDAHVRDITSYNKLADQNPTMERLPRIVIIIDELADLMMTATNDVETSICRIAQKARAAGIHLIIGTQRPSVDVITGLIKANIPSRIACKVSSQIDSRTIIDIAGAEKLIGKGDMLFAPVGASKPLRVQGAFVGETEVENIVEFIKTNNDGAEFNLEFATNLERAAANVGNGKKGSSAAVNIEDVGSGDDAGDPKLDEAVMIAIESQKISTSLLQRKLGIGYGRAAKILDLMEEMGYISAPDGNKPRRILVTKEMYLERKINSGE